MTVQDQIEIFNAFRYKEVRSENIELLLQHMGYSFMKKHKFRSATTISLQKRLSCFCEQYELIEINVDKTKFIPGRTNCFPVYSFANGRQSKMFYFDKNKLVKVQKGRKKIVTVWEFSHDAVAMTIKVDDIVAKKYYERTYDFKSAGFCCC